MGLDMYMSRTKKIDGMTLNQIVATAEYIDYLNRPEKYSDCTLKEWNGYDESDVCMDRIEDVKANIHTCYPAWDDEKEYGHEGVSDGVAYWRKANAIHNWFVENCGDGVDNCEPVEITKEMLDELLRIAKAVKKNSKLVNGQIKDPSVAMKLLPTTSGFFFGSTDYDEWYMENIDSTIKQISEILKTTDFDKEYVTYEASW